MILSCSQCETKNKITWRAHADAHDTCSMGMLVILIISCELCSHSATYEISDRDVILYKLYFNDGFDVNKIKNSLFKHIGSAIGGKIGEDGPCGRYKSFKELSTTNPCGEIILSTTSSSVILGTK